MRDALHAQTNLLTPHVAATGDADAFARLLHPFAEAGTAPGKFFDGTFNVNTANQSSLPELRRSIGAAFAQAWGEGETLHAAASIVRRSFDVLCSAFGLEDGDLADMSSMYATLIIYRYAYGGTPKYAAPHYEFQSPTDVSYLKSYAFANFVVSSFPYGTVAYDQAQHPFGRTKEDAEPDRITHSPALDWNAYSACIPHSAPRLPQTHEEALAMLPPDVDPDLAALCVRPEGVLRIVSHAGFRLKDQHARHNERGLGVVDVGSGFGQKATRLMFPRYDLTRAA